MKKYVFIFVVLQISWGAQAQTFYSEDWNFHKVVEHFYRSKRPTKEFLKYLKFGDRQLQTVISLEDDAEAIRAERKMCEELGLSFISLPMKHWDIQDHDYIITILDKIEWELGQEKSILIHCAEGKDRTGLIVALFRMLRQFPRWSARPWTKQQALDEMFKYGFHEKFTPLLGHLYWEYDQLTCAKEF